MHKFLIKFVGTTSDFKQQDVVSSGYMTDRFKALVMNKVKSNRSRAIKECEINILEINSNIGYLSKKPRVFINETLDDYGKTIWRFYT